MASGPIILWQIIGETMETVTDFIFEGLQNHCRWWLQSWNQKMLAPWKKSYDQPSSVQFSWTVLPDSLQPHEPQHARLPCPLSTAGVYPNPYPLMPSNHLIFCCPLLLLPSIFPSIRVFSNESALPGGQNIGVSASTSDFPMNTQDWFPLGWTGWISLQSKGLSRVFSNTTVQKHQFFSAQISL